MKDKYHLETYFQNCLPKMDTKKCGHTEYKSDSQEDINGIKEETFMVLLNQETHYKEMFYGAGLDRKHL